MASGILQAGILGVSLQASPVAGDRASRVATAHGPSIPTGAASLRPPGGDQTPGGAGALDLAAPAQMWLGFAGRPPAAASMAPATISLSGNRKGCAMMDRQGASLAKSANH